MDDKAFKRGNRTKIIAGAVIILALLTSSVASAINVGDLVVATDYLNVREGAGLNFKVIGTVPPWTCGTVIGGPQSGSGYTWYKIHYANFNTPPYSVPDGWSAANWLEVTDTCYD